MIRTQRKAIEMNNHAVSLMESGFVEKAFDLFREALATSQTVLDSGYLDHQRGENCDLCMDNWMAKKKPDASENEVDESQDGFIYQRPITIPKYFTSSNYETSIFASTATMFNLALACHLSALKMDYQDKIVQLLTSRRLYELAFNLQLGESFASPNVMFTMAIVNNLGSIYQQLNDHKSAGKCFERVLSTLMFVVDCGDNSSMLEVCDGFLRSTAHLYSRQCTAAAA